MNYTLAIVFACERIKLADCIKVFGKMRGLKLRICGLPHVVFCKLTIGVHGAAQQSAAEGAVSERGDAAAKSEWQNVAFYLAFEEIVRGLNGVKRRDGSETRHLYRRIVANADGTNFPLFIELAKCGGCLLDGDDGVRPVHLIAIDVVRLETTERILKLLENALARGVAFDLAIRPIESDFGGKDNAVSATMLAQGFTNDFFRTPKAVNGRCVDQVDALVECGMNGANGFLFVASAPHPAADGPGAESDSGTNKIRTVDFDVFQHDCPSRCLVRNLYISIAQAHFWLALCLTN